MKFKNDQQLAKFVKNLGGTLWLVGGAVRDPFMGNIPHDKDFMISGVNLSDITFEKVTGHNFPVFLVEVENKICEVAMARTERKIGVGYKGFEFFTDKSITVQDDLARRDLTINSIALNVLTGEICDPFGGVDDIKNKILCHTTEAFLEDPLRIFRVARFATKFGFQISDETFKLMCKSVHELNTLPVERIWEELRKVLNMPKPSIFFEVLKKIGALEVFFPEVLALNVLDKHDGTAFNHTMRVMDNGNNELERFGLLVHDFGKGQTPKELHPSHFGHDKLGEIEVISFCKRLKVPKSFQIFGRLCAREHMRIKCAEKMRPGKFMKMVLTLGDSFKSVCHVSFIDSVFRENGNFFQELKHLNKLLNRAKLVFQIKQDVTGKELFLNGHVPGKHFGEILFQHRVEKFKTLVDKCDLQGENKNDLLWN